jgi:hypothetical protein
MQNDRNNSNILPNFLIIGAQKAATSTIYSYLREHPQVFMARKELAFFKRDYYYNRGMQFYSAHFNGWEGQKAIGEATPGYLHTPEAPKRIYQVVPDVKLIVSLRDPIDRAYSAYIMQQSKGSESLGRSFEEAVKITPEYIEHGRYYRHLMRYLSFFSLKKLCILIYENLRTNPQQFYDNICDFLDIERVKIAQSTNLRTNLGGTSRWIWIQKTLNTLYRTRNYIRNTPLSWVVNTAQVDRRSRKIRNQIAGWNRKKGKYPKLDPMVRRKLLPLVYEDNRLLEEKFSINVTGWNRA